MKRRIVNHDSVRRDLAAGVINCAGCDGCGRQQYNPGRGVWEPKVEDSDGVTERVCKSCGGAGLRRLGSDGRKR